MKPGEKYIIEIDHTTKTADGERAYIKGFRTLVFDQYGLDKLRHAEEIGDAYRRGFDDARKTSPDALPNDVIDSAYKRGWNDAMGRFPKSAEERHEIYQRGWNECAEKIQNIKDAAYQNGLDDAWKLARRLCMNPCDGGMSAEDLEGAFGSLVLPTIFRACSYPQAFQKVKALEKKKAEIRVGDEVEVLNNVDFFVVTNINDQPGGEVLYEGVRRDGRTARVPKSIVAKTGRHFDVSAFVGKEETNAG